jgi:hypothetical protein
LFLVPIASADAGCDGGEGRRCAHQPWTARLVPSQVSGDMIETLAPIAKRRARKAAVRRAPPPTLLSTPVMCIMAATNTLR